MCISDWSSDVCSSDLSSAVREELSKYISERPCPDCGGARLNAAARHVFVADRPLPDLVALPIDEALAFVGQMQPPGWRGEIDRKSVVQGMSGSLRYRLDGCRHMKIKKKHTKRN